MPRLWQDTIEQHRESVREAILDAAAVLVADQGLRSVTMSEIAERAGIGRATLYKYFPDVDAMLLAWHERQIARHLEELRRLRAGPGAIADRLEAVLTAYAGIHHRLAGHHDHGHAPGGGDMAAVLHRGEHVAEAQRDLEEFMRSLVAEAAAAGAVRDDVPPAELASYCLHALTAAARVRSKAAVGRLVHVTMAGLRSPG